MPPAQEFAHPVTHLPRRPWRLTVFVLLALALVWLRPMDQLAERYTDQGWKRALTTFAAARLLNGALSLAREVEITGTVLGVGGSFHPGAVLAPVDELVEQFSSLMLGATLSFALQRLVQQIFSAWPLCLALSVLLLAWLAWAWRRPAAAPRLLAGAALGLLCLRLLVPLIALGNQAIYQGFLAPEYEQAQARISAVKTPELPPPTQGEGWTDRARAWLGQAPELARQLGDIKAQAEGLVEHLVRLAAVFLLQTLVLPLLFLWAAWRGVRLLMPLGRNSPGKG